MAVESEGITRKKPDVLSVAEYNLHTSPDGHEQQPGPHPESLEIFRVLLLQLVLVEILVEVSDEEPHTCCSGEEDRSDDERVIVAKLGNQSEGRGESGT